MTIQYPPLGPPAPMFQGPVLEGNHFTRAWQQWLIGLYRRSETIINEWGTDANKSGFEADGTLLMTGDATTYDDINTTVTSGKVPAVNAPAFATVVGNLQAYQFAVNDYIALPPIEMLHGWKEGSSFEIHVHWATGGNNDATARGVKWEIEYAIANSPLGGDDVVFTPVTLTQASDTVIAANEVAATHKYSSLGTVAGTGYKIGAAIMLRLKRIAASGTAPAADPFAIQVGVHYERDTLGSRTFTTK